MSDDSNMIFGIRFRTYEQIDEFQPAGQVVAEAKTADEDRMNRFRIFKKDFQLPLQKRTWIHIHVFNNRKFSIDRELWHEYEVPLTPLNVTGFYAPNLFDHLFENHKDFMNQREQILNTSKDCMICPVPLYTDEDTNKNVMSGQWLVLDGRMYGGIQRDTLMVTRNYQDVINDTPEAECTPYPLPIYEKSEFPKSFVAMWDLNDGLDVHVGMEVVLTRKHQEVEGEEPITNKVTNIFCETSLTYQFAQILALAIDGTSSQELQVWTLLPMVLAHSCAMADHHRRSCFRIPRQISKETSANDAGLWRIRRISKEKWQMGEGEEAYMSVGVAHCREGDTPIHPGVDPQEKRPRSKKR